MSEPTPEPEERQVYWKARAELAERRNIVRDEELAHARMWGFPDAAYSWYEDLIEWLGDNHDEEWCDGPQDLIAEVKAIVAARDEELAGLKALAALTPQEPT